MQKYPFKREFDSIDINNPLPNQSIMDECTHEFHRLALRNKRKEGEEYQKQQGVYSIDQEISSVHDPEEAEIEKQDQEREKTFKLTQKSKKLLTTAITKSKTNESNENKLITNSQSCKSPNLISPIFQSTNTQITSSNSINGLNQIKYNLNKDFNTKSDFQSKDEDFNEILNINNNDNQIKYINEDSYSNEVIVNNDKKVKKERIEKEVNSKTMYKVRKVPSLPIITGIDEASFEDEIESGDYTKRWNNELKLKRQDSDI